MAEGLRGRLSEPFTAFRAVFANPDLRHVELAWADRKPGSGFGKLPLLMIKRIASKQGQRDDLSTGERRQLRDAMILQAHARDGRDILVCDDVKAFGREGDDRGRKLEALCGTRIMTVDEFCGYAKQGHSAA
jgi:hypothetical protein